MAVPRHGDTICPTGAVVLQGRRGVINRLGTRSTWARGQCTWCGDPVPPGRRTLWCRQWCVDAYQATQPGHQRELVRTRDQERCQICGVDCRARRLALRRWRRILQSGRRTAVLPRMAEVLALRGLPCSTRQIGAWLGRRDLWDVDHTVPISEGGHPYDLRNLRTLCPWCHAAETTAGAGRRAEQRRAVEEADRAQVALFDPAAAC